MSITVPNQETDDSSEIVQRNPVVVFATDCSGSMGGSAKNAGLALAQLIESSHISLSNTAGVHAVAFGDRPTTARLDSDSSNFVKTLKGYSNSDNCTNFANLFTALNQVLLGVEDGSAVEIVLLSDGESTTGIIESTRPSYHRTILTKNLTVNVRCIALRVNTNLRYLADLALSSDAARNIYEKALLTLYVDDRGLYDELQMIAVSALAKTASKKPCIDELVINGTVVKPQGTIWTRSHETGDWSLDTTTNVNRELVASLPARFGKTPDVMIDASVKVSFPHVKMKEGVVTTISHHVPFSGSRSVLRLASTQGIAVADVLEVGQFRTKIAAVSNITVDVIPEIPTSTRLDQGVVVTTLRAPSASAVFAGALSSSQARADPVARYRTLLAYGRRMAEMVQKALMTRDKALLSKSLDGLDLINVAIQDVKRAAKAEPSFENVATLADIDRMKKAHKELARVFTDEHAVIERARAEGHKAMAINFASQTNNYFQSFEHLLNEQLATAAKNIGRVKRLGQRAEVNTKVQENAFERARRATPQLKQKIKLIASKHMSDIVLPSHPDILTAVTSESEYPAVPVVLLVPLSTKRTVTAIDALEVLPVDFDSQGPHPAYDTYRGLCDARLAAAGKPILTDHAVSTPFDESEDDECDSWSSGYCYRYDHQSLSSSAGTLKSSLPLTAHDIAMHNKALGGGFRKIWDGTTSHGLVTNINDNSYTDGIPVVYGGTHARTIYETGLMDIINPLMSELITTTKEAWKSDFRHAYAFFVGTALFKGCHPVNFANMLQTYGLYTGVGGAWDASNSVLHTKLVSQALANPALFSTEHAAMRSFLQISAMVTRESALAPLSSSNWDVIYGEAVRRCMARLVSDAQKSSSAADAPKTLNLIAAGLTMDVMVPSLINQSFHTSTWQNVQSLADLVQAHIITEIARTSTVKSFDTTDLDEAVLLNFAAELIEKANPGAKVKEAAWFAEAKRANEDDFVEISSSVKRMKLDSSASETLIPLREALLQVLLASRADNANGQPMHVAIKTRTLCNFLHTQNSSRNVEDPFTFALFTTDGPGQVKPSAHAAIKDAMSASATVEDFRSLSSNQLACLVQAYNNELLSKSCLMTSAHINQSAELNKNTLVEQMTRAQASKSGMESVVDGFIKAPTALHGIYSLLLSLGSAMPNHLASDKKKGLPLDRDDYLALRDALFVVDGANIPDHGRKMVVWAGGRIPATYFAQLKTAPDALLMPQIFVGQSRAGKFYENPYPSNVGEDLRELLSAICHVDSQTYNKKHGNKEASAARRMRRMKMLLDRYIQETERNLKDIKEEISMMTHAEQMRSPYLFGSLSLLSLKRIKDELNCNESPAVIKYLDQHLDGSIIRIRGHTKILTKAQLNLYQRATISSNGTFFYVLFFCLGFFSCIQVFGIFF